MKKVRYSLLTLLTVVSFSGIWSNLNAQIYSHPAHRTKFFFNASGLGLADNGGSATIDWKIEKLSVLSRGVTLLDKNVLASFTDFYYPDMGPGTINSGYFADSYLKIDDKIEVVAGQEISINCQMTNNWANAALYIDWDGNGVFDDHELLQNNLYHESCNNREEHHDVPPSDPRMKPIWTINVPKTYVREKVVRCRIKNDEGVRHYVERRCSEIYANGVPGCSDMGKNNQDGGLNGTKQYFFTMAFNRFMPSASPFRGVTVDFDLTVVPDAFLNQTIESESIIPEVGSVTCETTNGIAISNEADFEAFLAASSGNYYLSQDITISSTLDVSQTTFGGTFDGNGHTITISPTTTTKAFNTTSKDAIFYPYGDNQNSGVANKIRENILTYNWGKGTVATDPFPSKTIGGGFCGVLDFGGVIKNVKVVYTKSCTYQGGDASLFGLVAGIAKGKVENVSVDIENGATVKVESNGTTVGACGGIAGVLFRGIVKNCEVNVDGVFNFGKNSGTLPRESVLGGLVGRLQAGVIGNVKFGGIGTLSLAATNNVNYSRFYIGGIAGMTNTPQGAFCSDFQYEWGYDNGTVGLDVNNVILNFSGNMDMGSEKVSATHNYYCRGLLFAEATDTVTVPNLITQYASLPTIESAAKSNRTMTGLDIPLISTTAGKCGSGNSGKLATTDVLSSVGKLYLYKDGRNPNNQSSCTKFTNITTADTELSWAYEVQTIEESDGSTYCVSYSTPYAVATYTGTNANVQGIESASANVSDLGSAMVKIDPRPADVASPSWTWSETASPVTPDTDAPVCGGGGGEIIYPMADAACTSAGNMTNGGRRLNSFTISDGNGNTVTATDIQPTLNSAVYVDKTASVLTTTAGSTLSFSDLNWIGSWMHAYVYIDYNNNGTFDQVLNANGANSGELVSYNFYSVAQNANGQNSEGQALTNGCGVTKENIPSWTLPADLPNGIYRLRFKVDWNSLDPCGNSASGNTIAQNGGCICDITLNIGGVTPNATATDYCAQPTFLSHTTGTTATGYLKNLTANGVALATNWNSNQSQNTVGNTITINPGENLNLDFTFQCDWNNGGDDKGLNWTTAFAFVDLNGDGDFTDSGERIYARGGGGCNRATDAILPDGRTGSDATWTGTKTVTLTAASKSMLRIYTIGEYNDDFVGSTNGSKAAFDTGCATRDLNGDSESNKFHCYDFPIVINVPAAGGDGCAYVANFGNVFAGEVATYDIKLGAGSGAALNPEVPDDEYTLNYNDATGMLTVTYNVPATLGAVAVDTIGGITKGGDVYRIAVSATVKAAPTVTFRMSDEGGGALSLDMGKTTFIEPRTLAPYKGDLLTAVPVGPTHIVGWYVSTDGGTTFNAVGHANPDYTYTGADDAIVEVRFDFDDFEGNFGNSRFTNNGNVPFYISAISTTDGIVNVNATNVFTDATVKGGSARLRYMENQRLQTLHKSLKTLTHNVTVTVQNANKIPADARLMCFIDYNMNNYFDFASSPDGLASALSENGELVFVVDPNDTEAEQTFTFQISNANIDKFGKTRMRFMVATYVDMFGLGPVNQYGNYQPRFDTDGDGVADSNLPLNDNNGSVYTPNDQCRLENYVNVADVTFEVVAYVRYNDKYTIKNGESVRMKNLYIEAQEDATGFHAGQIVFDKKAPYGSLIVEGNIIVRRRIYPDKWHDVAFPIEMQGIEGQDGICAVGANGTLAKLPTTGKHLVYEFDPAGRNTTGGYGGGTKASADATFVQNKFYEFAADVPDGFTANDAGADIDGVNSYWIQFHSVDTGFTITPSAAKTAILSYTRDEDAAEYWNRNVFTIYNPFLSNINVNEITASLGWEHITWWNALQGRYTGVSAAETRDMPPYFGYWIQFTEGIGSGTPVEIVLGDANRADYPYADDRIVNFVSKMAPRRSALSAEEFDTPDSYTLGIDAAEDVLNETAASTTIVTLTDAGSIDEFRAGYDMPASLMSSSSAVPEIWSQAGSSAMMFNDVQRAEEVVVPVSIRIKESGEYALRLTHTNDSTSQVQVYDKETGATIDLQNDGETSTYSFLADEGDSNRFDLIISKAPKMVTDLEFVETLQGEQGAQVFVRGETLYLKNISEGYCVSICDVIGREYVKVPITGSEVSLPLPGMRGVYVVNILDKQNNSVQSVKVTK